MEGILTGEPTDCVTKEDATACVFSVASTRCFKSKDDPATKKEVSCFDILAFSKLAECVKAQGRKGRRVRVIGRLRQYTEADDNGKEHSRVFIIAERIKFLPTLRRETEVKP
jgi:single-strand DNA-binding protein